MDYHLDRPRRTLMWISGFAVLLLVGLAGGWALRALLAPAPDVLESPGYTLATAERGTVEHTLQLNTTAQWAPEATVAGQAAGTVTSIALDNGAEASPGDALYTVDLRPVVVAEGDVPAFRDLSRGAEGDDVAQLQRLLAERGHWTGDVDGAFREGLYWAVRSWQRERGLEADGVVRLGDVVFVPQLPARLALDEDLAVGVALAGGEPVVQLLPEAPTFTIALPDGQARLVEAGMAVDVSNQSDEPWPAEIVEIRRTDDGQAVAVLAGTGGGHVCGDDCHQVPLQEETLLPSTIHVVPEASGVTVPAAAVVTTAAGETVVVHEDGTPQPVDVVASASGAAVVEGIDTGVRVRVPGDVPADAR